MSENLKFQPIAIQESYLGCQIDICVQLGDFTVPHGNDPETPENVYRTTECGAEVSFIGRVRGTEQGSSHEHGDKTRELQYLELEHYPAMTESALLKISRDAVKKWSPNSLRIVHRVGRLQVGEPIVLVEVLSAHRKSAFNACEYVMDFLKMDAPFWKKAVFVDGLSQWIEQHERDLEALDGWR